MQITVKDSFETLPLSGVSITPEGYLQANVYAVRTGIQLYTRDELARMGVPDLPQGKDVLRIYRPAEEVFHKDSVASFARKPLTNDHPDEAVVADNWKKLSIGETDSDILRDGESLRIPMIVRDADGIAAIKAGKREVSAGYTCEITIEDGVAPDGTTYDGVQRSIRGNHVAIVDRGRAGSKYRIGDNAASWGASPISTADKETPMNLQKLIVDGLTVETTDAGAQAITKLQGLLKDAQTALDEKDRENAELQGKLDKATAAVPTADAIAKLVADRAALIADARTVADIDYAKLATDADIRRAAVTAKMGDAATAGKSDAYLEVRFDDLVKDAADAAKADPVRKLVGDSGGTRVNANDGGDIWGKVSERNGFATK